MLAGPEAGEEDRIEAKLRAHVAKLKPRPESGNPYRERHDRDRNRRTQDGHLRKATERRTDEKSGRPAHAHWMAGLRAEQAAVSGLEWTRCNGTPPSDAVRLDEQKLAAALFGTNAGKVVFTDAAWDAFRIHNLRAEHVVVGSAAYFTPAGVPPTNLERLRTYQGILHDLGGRVHTCPCCRERAHDHGTTDPNAWCWACTKNPNLLPWWNGLDLEVGCQPVRDEEEAAKRAGVEEAGRPLSSRDKENKICTGVSDVPWESRRAWQKLQKKYGALTPLEEALVSRVTACTTVLRLPSEQQLGYRGNVINFVNDLPTVHMQLPLAPKDCGVIVYRISKEDGRSELERVRKKAVEEYLFFFSEHHAVYRYGVRNPRAQPGDADEYIIPPFVFDRDFNEEVSSVQCTHDMLARQAPPSFARAGWSIAISLHRSPAGCVPRPRRRSATSCPTMACPMTRISRCVTLTRYVSTQTKAMPRGASPRVTTTTRAKRRR